MMLRIALATLIGLALTATAHAQSCSIAPSNLAFGTVSPVQGSAATASASFSVTCSGYGLSTVVRTCLNLGSGSAGTSYTPRSLASGAATVGFNLYADPTYSTVIGNRGSGSAAPLQVDVPITLLGGSGSRSITIYGQLINPSSAAAGAYSSTFAGTDAELDYAPALLLPTANCATFNQSPKYFSFNVSATVATDCLITASDIAFGSTGVLSTTLRAASNLNVSCTRNAPFTVALDAGRGSGATVASRRLTRSGGTATVNYSLYRDAGYSQPWGNGTAGTVTVAGTGTGTGAAQAIPVYAQVPAQSTPAPGTYTDTITATVSY